MLRNQQEKLEEKIADIQEQNSKLRKLVDQSNVDTVRTAIKEKDAALSRAAEEKQKAKYEIAKAKKQANEKISDIRKKLSCWQFMAVGLKCTVASAMLVTVFFIDVVAEVIYTVLIE